MSSRDLASSEDLASSATDAVEPEPHDAAPGIRAGTDPVPGDETLADVATEPGTVAAVEPQPGDETAAEPGTVASVEPQPADETAAEPETAAAIEPQPADETAAEPGTVAAVEPRPDDETAAGVAAEPEAGDEAPGEAGAQTATDAPTETEAATDADAPVLAPVLLPSPVPAPPPAVPRPAPSPAALAARVQAGATARHAAYGRVADDGTVYVRTADGEREVGSYPGASPGEALAYFARKFEEAWAAADLLLQRVLHTELSARDGAELLGRLREQTSNLHAVGDLQALDDKVGEIIAAVEGKRAAESAERAAVREAGRLDRERVVLEAESIAAKPVEQVQWKSSGARMRELLEDWKRLQRSGPRLEREAEAALWQRFSAARSGFDKARRAHFAQLDSTQGAAKAAKEALVKEAEALASSREWSSAASSFKRLMDRWREAGRASRADDDALWARFKTAQDSFFAAKDKVAAAENEGFAANLAAKEALLKEAEALLPVTDVEAAKSAMRGIQDRWDKVGKVPRGDMERIDKALRRVEQTVRDADDKRWKSSNPEAAARARSLVDQLETAVAALRADLSSASAAGNAKKVAEATAALKAREQWLAQARSGLAEFSR